MKKPKKKSGGRPRVEPAGAPIFDSMQQCSAVMRIPLELLKAAKAAGCAAFKTGSRVDVALFCEWAFSKKKQGDGVVDWSQALARIKTKREEIRLSEDEKRMVARPFVQQEIQTALAMLFGEIDKTFCTQLPPDLKGRTEAEIRARCVEASESMKAALREQFTKVAEGKDA